MAVTRDGVFHPVWMEEGAGQIWTASVSIGEGFVAKPTPSLSGLEDVSSQVTFDFANNHYDEVAGTLSLDVGVINRTAAGAALKGPLVMQLTDLHSDLGTIEVENADNGVRGIGAVWDLSNLLPSESLAPGAISERRRLLFRISKPKLSLGRRFEDLVIVRAKMFGKLTSKS